LKFEFRFVGYIGNAQESYAAAFLERLKPLEAAGCARYLGMPSHEDMVRAFDAAAGTIHFPTEEAFGSVAAEAFARDLKYFGARTGGITEIAEGMPEAELFESSDRAGLTEAIARWIGQGCPSPRGASLIARKRYHPEVYVQQHLQVYREVLSSDPNRRPVDGSS
jgi:glycosyltransferase involved in cell wall biosynthesis